MFNPQAPPAELSIRSLVFRQALAAAFKSRRQNLPPAPASLPALLSGCQNGVQGLLGRPGCRDVLGEIRARLFHTPGRDAEVQALWHEGVATAVFAARVAQLRQAAVPAAFLGALLHRSGEALALKMLARVELEYRMTLDSASRRDWCTTHSFELTERLMRTWKVPQQVETCALGWMRVGESDPVSQESTAVYLGRLFAIEFLQPQFCVPGALDHAAADLGLSADLIIQVRHEEARSLIRALD
jgi:hypothetical protein